MIYTEHLLKIIQTPHVSEKTSIKLEKFNTIVLKVSKYSTKTDVKNAVCMLFSVEVIKVNILITSKKLKGSKNNLGYRSSWKKAYVFIKHGYKIDFTNKIKSIM